MCLCVYNKAQYVNCNSNYICSREYTSMNFNLVVKESDRTKNKIYFFCPYHQ